MYGAHKNTTNYLCDWRRGGKFKTAESFDDLISWTKWQVEFNPDKCEETFVDLQQDREVDKLEVNEVEEHKDLGMICLRILRLIKWQ